MPKTATRRAECADCGGTFTYPQLKPIKNFWQRVEPGEICPAGECPKCGALCHDIKPEKMVLVLRDPDGNIHGVAEVEGITKAGVQVLSHDASLYFNQHIVSFSCEQVTRLKGQAAAAAWLRSKNGGAHAR